jgi:tetratricopeptide (TPR) repeat protein
MLVKNVTFVGNDQARGLAVLYRNFLAEPGAETVRHVTQLEPDKADTINRADVLVIQIADSAPLDGLPDGTTCVYFPLVSTDFLWPFGNQPHPRNGYHGPFPSHLGDAFLNGLLQQEVTPEEAVHRYLAFDLSRHLNLNELYEVNLRKQRARDRDTGYELAGLIERHFREEPLFQNPAHPNLLVLRALIQQLGERLDIPSAHLHQSLERLTSPFPVSELPIHPEVVSHFQLRYPDARAARYHLSDTSNFTFVEYALSYMRHWYDEELETGIWLTRERRTDQALLTLKAALPNAPRFAAGHAALAAVLTTRGDQAGASEHFQRTVDLVALRPDARALDILAHLLLAQGRPDEGILLLRRAGELDPQNPHVRGYLVSLLAEAGRYTEAEMEARSEIKFEATAVGLHSDLARTLAKVGRAEDAVTAARRALELAPDDTSTITLLADLLLAQGRRDEAIVLLRRAAELEPQNPHVHADLGNQLFATGRLAEAETMLRKAIEIDPGLAAPHACLIDLLVQLGRREEAVAAARRASELAPENTLIQRSLPTIAATGPRSLQPKILRSLRDLLHDMMRRLFVW